MVRNSEQFPASALSLRLGKLKSTPTDYDYGSQVLIKLEYGKYDLQSALVSCACDSR